MNKRTRNMIIVLALVSVLLIATPFFFSGLEGSKDINTLGTVTTYRYLNGAWQTVAAGSTLDVSSGYAYARMKLVFAGQYSNSETKCSLVNDDGMAVLLDLPTITSGIMTWEFNVLTVAPHRYHFSFAGMYSDTISLYGVTPKFFILGGTGAPSAPTISAPADVVTVVNEQITIIWAFTTILPTHWEVKDGSTVLESGTGNIGSSTPQTVTFSFTPDQAKVYTISLVVKIDDTTVSASDAVKVTSVGTSSTSTTTTTPTGTTTTTTPMTTGATTTTSTSTSTSTDEPVPYDYSYLVLVAAGVVVVLILVIRKRRWV